MAHIPSAGESSNLYADRTSWQHRCEQVSLHPEDGWFEITRLPKREIHWREASRTLRITLSDYIQALLELFSGRYLRGDHLCVEIQRAQTVAFT